jgi:hypothetical protein
MAHLRFKSWMLNGKPGNVSWRIKRVIVRGVNHGLYTTSTTGGQHAAGSYHYSGRAVDMAGTREEMVRFQRGELQRHRRWRRHREIIGPDNEAILLRGSEADLQEGTALESMHDTHVHIAQ